MKAFYKTFPPIYRNCDISHVLRKPDCESPAEITSIFLFRTFYLKCFDSHSEVVFFPDPFVHLSILAPTQFMLHSDVSALHLPLVVIGGNSIDGGLVAFSRWIVQRGDEAVLHGGVVMHEFCQCGETALWRHIQLGERVSTLRGNFAFGRLWVLQSYQSSPIYPLIFTQ